MGRKGRLLPGDAVKKRAMYYHFFHTTFGFSAVVFQRDPFRVKRVFLPCSGKEGLKRRLRATFPTAFPGKEKEALALSRDIRAYFDGRPIEIPSRLLDMDGLTPLQQGVLKTVATVPHGATRSYGEIAAQIGRPRACRFVGTSLARNPFPVVIPCHRIIRADGSAGKFGGGTALKKRMLALERSSGT